MEILNRPAAVISNSIENWQLKNDLGKSYVTGYSVESWQEAVQKAKMNVIASDSEAIYLYFNRLLRRSSSQ